MPASRFQKRTHRNEAPVFLLSTAILAFEILLLRLFAIEHFHHFASMAIGMAMLGFGASGTALVLARQLVRGRERNWFEASAVLFAVSLMFAIPLAHSVSFDPTQILWDVGQWRALAVVYTVLAMPFVFGAGAVALALMGARRRVGRVYAANLLGSATGSVLALVLLAVLRPERAVAATAIPAAAGAALALFARFGERDESAAPGRVRGRWPAWRPAAWPIVMGALMLLAVATAVRPPWAPRIAPFKGLPRIAAFAEAKPAGESWGPLGWAAAIHAPSFRHAPGLSAAFSGRLPPQTALFVDGATAGAAIHWHGDTTALAFLRWLPSASAYSVARPDSVLVLGAADGLEVLSGLLHGAEDVTAVELNAPLARLADTVVAPESRVYSDPRVRLVSGDARAYVARARHHYDLVVMPVEGGFAGAAAGIHAIGEDYLNTVEAYTSYLGRLTPAGVLAITRWVDSPPRDATRVLLTVAAALRDRGVDDVGAALMFVRSWESATILVKPSGFEASEVARVREFARSRMFEIDWAPDSAGLAAAHAASAATTAPGDAAAAPAIEDGDEFNLLGRPIFTEAAKAVALGPLEAAEFARNYPFDVAPATDNRPYFGRFIRPGTLASLIRAPRTSWLPFAEWGYLALVVTLLQSAGIAALLTLVPALVLRHQRDGQGARMLRVGAYFGTIGAAYLLIEIAVIQKLTLLLGHPVYAAAAVLALFLALSGAGKIGRAHV